MPTATTEVEIAVRDISETFARAIEKNAFALRPVGYSHAFVLETIVACAEKYALLGLPHGVLTALQHDRIENTYNPPAIPQASPAVSSATSALAAAFFKEYWGHDKDYETNKGRFVEAMMRCQRGTTLKVSDEIKRRRDRVMPMPDMPDHFGQAYDEVWIAMKALAQKPTVASDHLNPAPLWHLNSRGHAKYADGPMPQLIRSIERDIEGNHDSLRQRGSLSKDEATQQITDIAIAGLELLREIDRGVEAKRPRSTAPLANTPSICSGKYYGRLDAAKVIRERKIAEKMLKLWKASLREGRTANASNQTMTKEGAIDDTYDSTTIDKVREATDRLLDNMREAIAEGILEQVKKDMQGMHPRLSARQIDYAVNLPLSLDPSEMEKNTSIASLIRAEVESAVTKGAIYKLMDDITRTADADINDFLSGRHSSNILGFTESIMGHILQALALVMDKITGTDTHQTKRANSLTIKAETKLMKTSIDKIARRRMEGVSPSGKWHISPLSELSGAIEEASAEVVNDIQAAKERRSGGRPSGLWH